MKARTMILFTVLMLSLYMPSAWGQGHGKGSEGGSSSRSGQMQEQGRQGQGAGKGQGAQMQDRDRIQATAQQRDQIESCDERRFLAIPPVTRRCPFLRLPVSS